jgi:hypothetical protein
LRGANGLNYKGSTRKDRFFVLDHWEGVSLANAVQKKLDEHLDEQFHQRVSMEVTKRVSDIMEDPEL